MNWNIIVKIKQLYNQFKVGKYSVLGSIIKYICTYI